MTQPSTATEMQLKSTLARIRFIEENADFSPVTRPTDSALEALADIKSRNDENHRSGADVSAYDRDDVAELSCLGYIYVHDGKARPIIRPNLQRDEEDFEPEGVGDGA